MTAAIVRCVQLYINFTRVLLRSLTLTVALAVTVVYIYYDKREHWLAVLRDYANLQRSH